MSEPDHPFRRIRTGVPRLDYILHGGLQRRHLHLIYGPTGSGKTVSANQLCFCNAAQAEEDRAEEDRAEEDRAKAEGSGDDDEAKKRRGRALYLTVAVESHAKIIDGVSTFDFFNPAYVGSQISYVSGYSTLRDEGADGLLDLIARSVRRHNAEILVLDGIQTVRTYANSARDYRAWLHLLQATLTMLDATGVLLASGSGDRDDFGEEALACDAVIKLDYHLFGPRFVREIVVYKFRGSGYLEGRHQVEIDASGMKIHPRTEIQFADPPPHAPSPAKLDPEKQGSHKQDPENQNERIRMGFGSEGLDDMLHGGVLSGSATALLGHAGTGKTTLGLSFLVDGARRGQPGYYVGFREPPPRLLAHAQRVGLGLQDHVDSGMIELRWQPPLEHDIDALANEILELFRGDQFRDDGQRQHPRLFIDGIGGFVAAAVYQERLDRFLSAFFNQLRTLNVTTVISEAIAPGEFEVIDGLAVAPTETTIALQSVRQGAGFHRLISILKMRESAYERFAREFEITADGLAVAPDHSSADKLLGPARGGRP